MNNREKERMEIKADCYRYYKGLMKVELERPIRETDEYKALFEHYPHVAESLNLKKEIDELGRKLKSAKDRKTSFQMKKALNETRKKLRRESMLEQLHGGSKQQAIYHVRFIIESVGESAFSFIRKCREILRGVCANAQRRMCRLVRMRIPPSILDLRSLDLTERGLVLREWVQDHRLRVQKQSLPTESASRKTRSK